MSTCRRGLTLLVVVAFVASSLLTCGSPDTGPAGEEAPAAETEELAEVDTVAPEDTATEPAPAESQIPAIERASDTPEPTDTPQVTIEIPAATLTATLAPGESLPPTSTDLIRQGLEAGELDEETALVYEVYAAFSDSRLPEAFQGDDSLVIDSQAVALAVELWDTLSPETRELLTPFRLPPNAPGSWWELRHPEAQAPGDESASAANGSSLLLASSAGAVLPAAQAQQGQWNSVWAVDGLIKVWYVDALGSPAPPIAFDLAVQIRTQIYPKLQNLMGRTLLPDDNVACLDQFGNPFPAGIPPIPNMCFGDDAATDVYLVTGLNDGMAVPYEGCSRVPSFVLLDWTIAANHGAAVFWPLAAHEMMHVFQFLFKNCSEYEWIREATAVWASDFVYPRYPPYRLEHGFAPHYLNSTHLPLVDTSGYHEYGAYLFFFFLRHYHLDASLIRKVWENTEKRNMDKYLAVDKAIPGGFAENWPKFAVYNWNEPRYDDYRTWDSLQQKAPAYQGQNPTRVSVGLLRDQMGQGFLSDLSITYMHYQFSGTDPRMVTFFNGLTWELKEEKIDLVVDGVTIQDGSKVFDWEPVDAESREGLSVQALYKIEGDKEWREVKDWTNLPYISFCRDAKAERLEELVIIYSSAKFKSGATPQKTRPQGLQPALLGSDIGCWRWEGEAVWEGRLLAHEGRTDGGEIATIPLVWERDEGFPDIPYPYVTYHLLRGGLEFEWWYDSTDGCTGQGTDSGALEAEEQASPLLEALEAGKQAAAMQTFYGVTQGPSQRRYLGWGFYFEPLQQEEIICTVDGKVWGTSLGPIPFWDGIWFPLTFNALALGQVFRLGPDGSQIQDGYESDLLRYDWDFEAQRE